MSEVEQRLRALLAAYATAEADLLSYARGAHAEHAPSNYPLEPYLFCAKQPCKLIYAAIKWSDGRG